MWGVGLDLSGSASGWVERLKIVEILFSKFIVTNTEIASHLLTSKQQSMLQTFTDNHFYLGYTTTYLPVCSFLSVSLLFANVDLNGLPKITFILDPRQAVWQRNLLRRGANIGRKFLHSVRNFIQNRGCAFFVLDR